MKRRLLLPLALLCASAASAAAQAGSCVLEENRYVNRQAFGGFATVSIAGPLRVECAGGTTLRADSAVLYEASNEVHLFGRVDYRDPTRTLTSSYATYTSATGRLYATGNVVFRDVTRGSTLRGPELEYFRAMAGRPQPQVIAGQRPHLTAVPSRPGERPAAGREPLEIDADRITSVGDHYFSATGNVVIHRSDLDATAAEAFHDTQQESLQLRGNARIRGERFDLSGETVEATTPGGSLDQVVARQRAELVSERLRVDGPEIRLFFEDDLLQRLVAHGPATGGERPLVTASDFRMEADSVEAMLPGQTLERVVAVGKAHGETVDTTAQPRPDTARARGTRARIARQARPSKDLLSRDRDWVIGDTIIGYFLPKRGAARTARADSARTPDEEVELDRVLAKGSARALYRVRENGREAPGERPALNYLAGDELEMKLKEGQMDVAQVRGLKRGLYLDPAPPGQAATPPAGGAPPAAQERRP